LGFAERQAVKDEKIKNAVILCGVGSVSSYRVHAVSNTTLPATLAYGELAVPMDLIALDGYVLRGRIDAHITMTDDRHAFGGHPHEGTKVFRHPSYGGQRDFVRQVRCMYDLRGDSGMARHHTTKGDNTMEDKQVLDIVSAILANALISAKAKTGPGDAAKMYFQVRDEVLKRMHDNDRSHLPIYLSQRFPRIRRRG
jgi:hypothetical protein